MFLIFEPTEATNFHVVADNNLYSQTDPGAFGQYPTPWPLGASSVNAAFTDWQTITGNDLAGKVGNPEFVSTTSAYINTAVGAVSAADSMGMPVATVTDDIDGEVHNAARPDAGADEFDVMRFVDDLAAQSIDSPLPTQVLKAGATFVPLGTFFNPGSTTYAAAPVVCEILDSLNIVVYTGSTTLAIGGYSNTAQAAFPTVPGLAAGEYTLRIIAACPGRQPAGERHPYRDHRCSGRDHPHERLALFPGFRGRSGRMGDGGGARFVQRLGARHSRKDADLRRVERHERLGHEGHGQLL